MWQAAKWSRASGRNVAQTSANPDVFFQPVGKNDQTDGVVTCWGLTPVKISAKAKLIEADYGAVCAVTTDGHTVYSGTVPPPPEEEAFKALACGHDHCIGLGLGGMLSCWGFPHFSQYSVPDP